MANRPGVFERLIGLETEYALAVSRQLPEGSLPGGKYRIFRELIAQLRRRIPTVDARHLKEGVFHAGGGAVWFETERPAEGGGLVEGASPECRSPRQLLAWQRAQDHLLSGAAEAAFGGDVRLLKNDRDAQGNIYGAQENYEVDFATGWQLTAWRISLVLLLPLVAVTWMSLWAMFLGIFLYSVAASLTYLALEKRVAKPKALARFLFGCEFDQLENACPTGPRWLEAFLSFLTRVLTFPLAAILYGLLVAFAFRKLRRQLTPFLISRPIMVGAGMIDDDGQFHLADKAPAMNCLTGYGGLLGDRPIYSFGHFFKVAHADSWWNPAEYLQLFSGKQRLQIAIGDSNRAEVAEYLRIGTTLLVIDAIEAGCLPQPVQPRRPIAALRQICADPSLKAQIPLTSGGNCTALELQRSYLEACRAFLHQHGNPPNEAWQILGLWEETLDTLEHDPSELVGSLDWITKQFLLEKAGQSAAWEVRKKIDLRYHELSDEGYFDRLQSTGIPAAILGPAEVEYATRNPPSGTPATVRGRYIREFAGGDEMIVVNWRRIYLGSGRKRRSIDLSLYRPVAQSPTRPSNRKSRRKDQG
ncbi:proteasome accessory factor PafA2 family protein [Anatilimnocola floriformis]|uniref:proteasome accessory factor PafA2 family protein n=1 Tax=Anatilimnocola floriformis TaxID=2948575 RepID=UPI0020C5838B|nr:proteasome accessory factor PafA2 family protein [Anatilimnocola floriformis]